MEYPIHVLCVFSTLDRGGAESMCMNLYHHINRDKVQFDFVKHTSEKGAFEDEILKLGGKIYEAPKYSLYNHIVYENWWKSFFKEHPECQIVHGHYFTISNIYFRLAHKAHRITIGHSHCANSLKQHSGNTLKYMLSNVFIRKIKKHSDYCLACSKAAGVYVFGEKPFIVFNNGIDSSLFRANGIVADEVRQEFSLGDCFVLGNVSRFNFAKNPYGTLEIFKRVHDKRPNSKLLWVGDGPMRAEVQENVHAYGLQDKVIFTGVRSDVHRLLQAMDVFVFPSLYEGLGIAAVEAQAAGVPTYCSTTVPEEASVTNLYHSIPIEDLEAWVDQICTLSASSIHQDTMEQIIAAGYDIHETAQYLEKFYIEILEGTKNT